MDNETLSILDDLQDDVARGMQEIVKLRLLEDRVLDKLSMKISMLRANKEKGVNEMLETKAKEA